MRQVPPKLYKYIPEDVALMVLSGWRLRFSTPLIFNDPFELRHNYVFPVEPRDLAIQREALKERFKRDYEALTPEQRRNYTEKRFVLQSFKEVWPGYRRDYIERLHEKAMKEASESLENELRSKVGILSLTKKCNNLIMWAHYANSHQGVVLEFDTNSPFFKERTEDNFNFVNYVDTKPSFAMHALDASFVYYKSTHWKLEDEWRIIEWVAEASFEDKDRYERPVYLFDIPPSAILRIVVGCNARESLEEELVASLRKNPEAAHITVNRAELDKQDFILHTDTVPFSGH